MTNMGDESCICVLAHPGAQRTTKPTNTTDQLTVQISVTIGALPKNPVTKFSPKIHYSSKKTINLPRRVFLSSDHAEQRHIITTMIEELEIPFPIQHENILWGTLNFPPDDRQPNFENLDDIKARLLDTLCQYTKNSKTGYMDVRISKVEKVSNEYHNRLLACGKPCSQPLDGWIDENKNNVDLHRVEYLGLIMELLDESPMDNKLFGLRSVKIDKETGNECFCLKALEKGKEAIQMPCSHVFHGFCILKWLRVNRSCPFCRSRLGNKSKR